MKRLSIEVNEPEDTRWERVMDSLFSDHAVASGMAFFALVFGIGTFAVVNGLGSGNVVWYVGAGILCLGIAFVLCMLMATYTYGLASLSEVAIGVGTVCILSGLLSVVVGTYIHLAL